MKKYTKPLMESEVFVANEYIGACYKNSSVSCLNMNSAKAYVDSNGNGVYDANVDKEWTGSYSHRNDCYMSGDETGANHDLSGITDLSSSLEKVFVVSTSGNSWNSTTTVTEAYILYSEDDKNSFGDSPHFISVKEANHS